MRTVLAILAAATSLLVPATAQGNGLSFEVPPPECLNNCIHTLGACNLCMTGNTYSDCIDANCDFRDYSYASAYLGSICEDGGYVSYDTTPPTDFYIATDSRTNCPVNGTSPSNSTSTPKRRSRIMRV